MELVDSTRLRDSLQCLRYYYWRHERGIATVEPKAALAYGTAVHASLAAHSRGKTMAQALLAFQDIWDRDFPQVADTLREEDPKRNPLRWLHVFAAYRQQYPRENDWVVYTLPNGEPAVEVPFLLPIDDGIAWVGIIDLIVSWAGKVRLVDHKTTSYLNKKWLSSFDVNHQFTGYLLAANTLLRLPQFIDTLVVNAILVHKSQELFDRVPVSRAPEHLVQFRDMLTGWWAIVQECRATGRWPQNDDRCTRWPDPCEYLPLCTDAAHIDFRRLLPSTEMYRQQVWDPIAQLRERGLEVTME